MDVTKLHPLSPEVISRQATINIGTIDHVAHGKSTVVKSISVVQTIRFKNELERNITIRLEYANAKIYKCEDERCPRPMCYKPYGSGKEDAPVCDVPEFENSRMKLLRHVSFVDCPLLGEPGTGGSSTPSMVGAVKKWQKSDPQKSRDTWTKLSNANSALETQLNLLRKLAEEHWDAYKCVISSCSICKSEEWMGQASEPSQVQIVKALLGSRDAMLEIRCQMRQMGDAAGIPIEPESQTRLLDATMKMEGVLLAGVPGAGGFDAIFAVTLGDASSTNLTKAWSSHNVLAMLVREDPRGVSLQSSDPRATEITSGISAVHIE